MNQCSICRRSISKDSMEMVCQRVDCLSLYTNQQALNSRIEEYRIFFQDKVPSEINYEEFLKKINLEDRYQKFHVYSPNTSRRVWFNFNIASVHHEWKDEFGRKFASVIP